MKNNPLVKITLPVVLGLSLASCGTYDMTTPVTAGQTGSKAKGVASLSGKPALRVPSKIGVFTTGRTTPLNLAEAAKGLKAQGHIQSIQPIDAFVSKGDFTQLSEVIENRAKLIQETRFLGLDVILVCDQQTTTNQSTSLLGLATLGIVDVGLRKQDTQLTVVCMDARTGYIYGVMGRQENGHAAKVSMFDNNMLGDLDRSSLVQTTRRQAAKEFPAFWNQLVAKYHK